jgi:hypothetical protein
VRTLLLLCIFLLPSISIASDFSDGVNYYQNGNIADAIDSFSKCKDTNVDCIHNLGVSYAARGQEQEARKWITESARYGNQKSINLLKKAKLPVPNTDLAQNLEKNQNKPVDDSVSLIGVMNAIVQGYNNGGRGNNNINCDVLDYGAIKSVDCR